MKLRRRRLTLAAIDLQNTNDRVIDAAIKYGYSSAVYPRGSFTLSLKGVQEMNFRLEKKPPFQILGVR